MFNSINCDSQEYFNFKSDYVSCIKVNGQPILPPLMTPERFLEMQKYKQLAIEVENKLKSKRSADKHTEMTKSDDDNHNDDNFYSDDSLPIETSENMPCGNSTFQSVASQTTLDHIPEKQNCTFNDDKNLVNSSELVTSGHSFIIEPSIPDNNNSKINSPKQLSIDTTHQGTGDTIPDPEPPRLIRTNSYILDTPSPLLVSFLENQRANIKSAPPKSANLEHIHKFSNENKRRSCWDLASAKEKWTSFENNINFAFIPNKINTKNVKSKFNRAKSASLPASKSPSPTNQNVDPKMNFIRRNSLTNESKTCRKQIFYNRSNSLEMRPSSERKSYIPTPDHSQNSGLIIDSIPLSQTSQSRIENENVLLIESKIKEIYQTLQEEHSNKMAELMIRQKKEQEMLIAHFKQQQLLFVEQIRNNYLNISNDENSLRVPSNNSSPNCGQQLPTVDNYLMVPESGSESEDMSSQTIHYQHENTSMMTTPDSDYCLNVENMIHDNCYREEHHGVGHDLHDVNKIVRRMITGRGHRAHDTQSQRNIYIQNNIPVRFHINNYTNISNYESCDIENVVRCTSQSFSNVPPNSNSREICAVIKIQAGVRGYLVRRLLRTERVQSLIQTLKDTLICALEFHTENIDNIQPADVELHKRLIQQLTAACFAIHDTFFKLTTKEKMAIIASDRQRIKDKILRPPSAKSSPILSATTQKTMQRKLLRSNISTPSFDENQTPRKACEHGRTGSVLSGTSNTTLMSSTRSNKTNSNFSFNTTDNNIRMRGSPTNKLMNKKPWR